MDLTLASLRAAVLRFGSVVAWALLAIITARALSVSDRGVYAAAILVIEVTARLASNFTAGAVHQIAGGHRPVDVVLRSSIVLGGWASVLVLLLGLAVAGSLEGADRRAAMLATFAIPPSIGRQVFGAALLAVGHVGRSQLVGYGSAFVGLALVALACLGVDGPTANGALLGWAIAQYLVLVLAVVLARQWTFVRVPAAPGLVRSLLTFGAVAGLVGFVALLERRVDLLLVASLDGSRPAALYSAASSLAELLLILPGSIAVAATARLGKGSFEEAGSLVAACSRHAVLLAVAGTAGVAILGPPMLAFTFGAAYGGAGGALRILAVATPFVAPQAVATTFFVVRLGRPGLSLVVVTAGAFVEVGASLVLIPALGIKGAATADLLGYIASSVAFTTVLGRLAGIAWYDLWVPRLSDLLAYRHGVAGLRASIGVGGRLADPHSTGAF